MTEVLTQLGLVAVGLLVAGAVAFFALGLYQLTLGRLVEEARQVAPGGGAWAAGGVAVRKLGAFNRRMMWVTYESLVRRQLVRAGEPRGYRAEDIMALQEIGAVVGLVVGLVALQGLGWSLWGALLFAVVGAAVPLLWVLDQVKRRNLLISRALPYHLDLLTLAVEAGLDFTAGLAKVVEKGKPGPLREELQLVLKQLKVGKTREEALKGMIARVDLPSLSSFVNALIQADKMGTGVGKVLRIQASQLRLERTQRAEKLAQEAPVKMLLPLIACIFPTVFLILFGPIVFAFLFGNVGG